MTHPVAALRGAYNCRMALDKHKRTSGGTYRRERGDALAKNLRGTYPEFKKVHGSTRLDTLRDRFGVDSINDVRKHLRDL